MSHFLAISLSLLAATLPAVAAPRIASVRIETIYAQLPSTVVLERQLAREQAAIMKGPRARELSQKVSELQVLRVQLDAKPEPLDTPSAHQAKQDFDFKRQELQALQQDFAGYQAEQEKLIHQKRVAGMRASQARILAVAGKLAVERGYDLVFDRSGHSNTGLPFVIFCKSAPDLTTEIRAALARSEPVQATAAAAAARPAAAAKPKPEPQTGEYQ